MIVNRFYSNQHSGTSSSPKLPPMLINENLNYLLDGVSIGLLDSDDFYNINVFGKKPYLVFFISTSETLAGTVQNKFKKHLWIDKTENSSIDDEISSTLSDSLVRGEMAQIFRENAGEVFETGMDNKFRQRIKSMLNNYSRPTVDTLSEWIQGGVMDVELLSESLRSVGASRDESTMEMRLELLVTALAHPSPIVRDSAIISLSDLANPLAIPHLKDALKKEKILSLRNDMMSVLEELNGDEHTIKKT